MVRVASLFAQVVSLPPLGGGAPRPGGGGGGGGGARAPPPAPGGTTPGLHPFGANPAEAGSWQTRGVALPATIPRPGIPMPH